MSQAAKPHTMKQFYTQLLKFLSRGTIMKLLVLTFMVSFATLRIQAQSGLCNSGVPFFNVDLRHSPSATFISPSGSRSNNCCGTSFPDRCVEFEVFLHPSSTGIRFDIYSGAVPPGAMFYQINCGPQIPVGQFVCLAGQGPHTITFCKPGNNPNSYFIEAIPAEYEVNDTATRVNCPVTLLGRGLNPATVVWRDITGNGIYDNLLSCTSACNETVFTPVAGVPSQIQYEVCGSVLDTICNNYYPVCDTLTVTIHPEIQITVASLFRYCETSGGININPVVSGGTGNYTYSWTDTLGNTISTSPTFFASKGNYVLNVNDDFKHCPPHSVSFIVEEDLRALVNAGNDSMLCATATSIVLSGNVELAPSGIWSGGTTSLNFPNTTLINDYNITQQDINNGSVQFILRSVGDTVCPAVRDTVVYTILQPLLVQEQVNQISCNATNNGSIIANVSGGLAPYQYSLDGVNFQPTNSFLNLAEGNYIIIVRDAAGCETSISADINAPMSMNANINVNAPVCVGNVIELSAFANGATNYQWSGPNGFSANGSDVSRSNAALVHSGLYTVTISNSNCTLTESISVNVLPAPTANAGRDTSLCAGNFVTIGGNPATSGGQAPYSYQWQPTTGLSNGNIANPVVVVTQSLNYTLTVTDANGCIATDLVEIILGRCDEICTAAKGPNMLGAIGSFSEPYLQPNTAAANCLRNDLNTFSQVNNIALPKPQQTTYTYTAANGGLFPEGRYTFIKNMGDHTGASCLHSRFHAVEHTGDGGYFMAVNGSPDLALYGNTFFRLDSIPVCPNTNYEFSAFVTNILSGLYNQPPHQFPNISFFINNVIVATSGPIPNNPGQVLNDWIKAGGVWNSGNANYANIRIDNATVIATGNDLGIDDIIFSVCGPIIIDDNPNRAVCVGEAITITQNINSTGTTDYSFYKWQLSTDNGTTWNDASDVIGESQSPTIYNATLGPITATLAMDGYLYRVLVSNDSLSLVNNNNYCYAVGPPSLVSVRPSPSAFAGNDAIICIGDSATLGATIVASGGTAPYQYQWNNTATLNFNNIANPIAIPASTTNYSITVTDATGCTATDNVLITISNPQIVDATIQHINCFGNNNGAINITIDNGISPYSFSWSNGSNAEDIFNLEEGNYDITVTDAIGCSVSETYLLIEPTPLAIGLNKTDVSCNGGNNGNINFSVSGATSPYNFSWNDGNILPNRTNLIAGNYSVTVTDANSCSEVVSINITEPVAISITNIVEHVSCFGGNNGYIAIEASGGNAPYTYSWSNGINGEINANLVSGIYTLTVYDINNCSAEQDIEITQPNAIAIAFSVDNVSCYGGNNGSVEAIVSGGVVPYNYLWNNGIAANEITGLEASQYEIMITDNNGCIADSFVTIHQPDSISINAIIENVLCYGGSDGSINVSSTGGTMPYSYSWSNNWFFELNRNIPEGNYSVTVTDANNCIKTENYYVAQPAPLAFSLTGTELICINATNGQVAAQVSGGTPFYRFMWSNGSQSSQIENLSNGVYEVTVSDVNNCSVNSSFQISEYVYEANIELSETEICLGDSATFNVNTFGAVVQTYFWMFGDGFTTMLPNVTKGFTTSGNYNASVGLLLSNGCFLNINTSIIVHALPNVNAGNDVFVCPGNNTTLEATGAESYVWSSATDFIQITDAIIRTLPETNSVYYVTGTDANGCVNNDSVSVFLHEILPLEISNDTLLCSGTSTTLKAEGAVSYQWNNAQYLSCDTCSETIALADTTTVFVVNAIDVNGCNVSDSVIVYVVPMPSGLLSQSLTTCENSEVTLRAFPQANVTYSWQPDSLVSNANSHTIKVTPSETTTFTLSSTTNFGCNRIDTVIITVLPKPFLNIDDSISYCFGESYQIQLDSSLNYTWQPTIGLSCSQCSNPLITNNTNQIYTVSYVANNGCSFTDTIQLNVLSLPELDLGVSRKICKGDIVNITAEAPTATSILWSPSQGLNTTNTKIVQASPNADIVYIATVSDAKGCVNSDSILVEVINEVQIHLDSLFNICIGEMITIIPSILAASDAHIQYSWLPENRFNNPNAESQTIMPRNAESYQLIVSSGSCIPDTQSFFVNVYQGPSVFITAPEYVIAGQNFEVSAEAIGASIYNWQYDENNLLGYESSIIAQIFQPTTFTVNVTDENNCSATQFRIVKVIDNCGDNIFIPNAFTPNGDEINDKLCIRSLELEGIKIFRIFNRWGELVFETTDLNHCWDGYYKGKIVNPDVYVYYAEGICTNGQNKLIKGNVTVLR